MKSKKNYKGKLSIAHKYDRANVIDEARQKNNFKQRGFGAGVAQNERQPCNAVQYNMMRDVI